MIDRRTFVGTGLAAFASSNFILQSARAADEQMIHVNIGTGADTNPGTKQSLNFQVDLTCHNRS